MTPDLIRVLVVDDSAFMRKTFRELLESSPLIKVVGAAYDGRDALEKVRELEPDVVLVDLYMPEMDGVSFVQQQMRRRPLPIVLCSSATEDAQDALAAMEAGAIDYVRKPTAQALDHVRSIGDDLVRAVTGAAGIAVDKLRAVEPEPQLPARHTFHAGGEVGAAVFEGVLIGISTGGPRALRALLPRFPANFPAAVAIVLHMPPGYTQALAQKLDELSALEVVESGDGVEMLPGRVVLAQAGRHTTLARRGDGAVVTRLSSQPADALYCPSVDVLFKSGAEVYGSRALGVVMTGMGNDGTAGAAWIKAQGGQVFVEHERTSVIYGMPRAVVEAGLADRVIPLDQMAEKIMEALE